MTLFTTMTFARFAKAVSRTNWRERIRILSSDVASSESALLFVVPKPVVSLELNAELY
jgi:hypothetical protein